MVKFSPMRLLSEERALIEASLAELYGSFVASDGIGFGKRVGDGTAIAVERITEVGKQEMLLGKLRAIELAELAMEEGTYGSCRVCGVEIPQGRLEVRPWSIECIKHAK